MCSIYWWQTKYFLFVIKVQNPMGKKLSGFYIFGLAGWTEENHNKPQSG
jgi:hypothetical protein